MLRRRSRHCEPVFLASVVVGDDDDPAGDNITDVHRGQLFCCVLPLLRGAARALLGHTAQPLLQRGCGRLVSHFILLGLS